MEQGKMLLEAKGDHVVAEQEVRSWLARAHEKDAVMARVALVQVAATLAVAEELAALRESLRPLRPMFYSDGLATADLPACTCGRGERAWQTHGSLCPVYVAGRA